MDQTTTISVLGSLAIFAKGKVRTTNSKQKTGVGKHKIGPVGRPTGSINPVGRHYIGPLGHEAGS